MAPRMLSVGALLAAVVIAPCWAMAQPPLPPPPPRPTAGASAPVGQVWVVITKIGATWVGNLVESVPDSHVTIRLATGEVHRVEAANILRQGPGGRSDPPREAAPLVTHPALYTGPGAVHMSIAGGSGQLVRESRAGWSNVCELPCSTMVDPNGNYKVHSSGNRDTSEFQIPQGEESVDLVVKGEPLYSMGNMRTGIVVLTSGAPAMMIGTFLLSGMFDGGPAYPGHPAEDHSTTHLLGGVLLGVGAALVGLGVYLMVARPNSSVETRAGKSVARREKAPSGFALTPTGFVF